MKKLIFGLGVFFTSVFGIMCTIGFHIWGRHLMMLGAYPMSAMETCSIAHFVFVITAATGFIFALIGVFSHEKINK